MTELQGSIISGLIGGIWLWLLFIFAKLIEIERNTRK